VYTKPISIAGATGDVTVSNAELDLPSGVTVVSATDIKVIIHLASQQSTRTVSIGIVVSGASPDLIYGYSSLNATVTIGGATAALNAFDTSTLTGNISVQNLGPGTYTVNVSVSPPAGIKLVGISPVQITVTITSPATPTPSPSPSGSATPSP
jgi:YbbR domain-containing protein